MPNRRNSIYVLLIFSLIAGLLTGRGFFFNMGYLFGALLFLAGIWSWLSINWVQIGRQTRSRRAQVGRPLEEYFTVKNTGLIPKIWLEVRDHSELPGHHASFVVPTLRPFGTFRWAASTICTVRGEFTLGPLTLITGDPFGLFQATRHISATTKLLVYPPIVPVTSFTMPIGVLAGGDAQRQRTHVLTTNAAGVRDYAPGDGFNRIHWKSSARKDTLLVKEFELDPMAEVWIFIDLAAASLAEVPYSNESGREGEFFLPPSSGEYAIVAATSLAQYFLLKERSLGFVTYNPARNVLQPDRGSRQITRILETLAMARFEQTVTCAQMLALEGHHMSRGTTVVMVTADCSESWIQEAALLNRRGMRVVPVLIDPHSFGRTDGRSGTQTRDLLESMNITTYLIQRGNDIGAVLSQRR